MDWAWESDCGNCLSHWESKRWWYAATCDNQTKIYCKMRPGVGKKKSKRIASLERAALWLSQTFLSGSWKLWSSCLTLRTLIISTAPLNSNDSVGKVFSPPPIFRYCCCPCCCCCSAQGHLTVWWRQARFWRRRRFWLCSVFPHAAVSFELTHNNSDTWVFVESAGTSLSVQCI